MISSEKTERNDWDVPENIVKQFTPKTYRYALVIPVINEGERIRNQLRQLFSLNCNVDVVITDGGSSDGSLDHEFLKSVGVRTLITKTGPGKLSAQLRCAYSWCLSEKYEGIVTVDGNNKDSMESVSSFARLLNEGYDYVQGSRYAPEGVAINTPFIRTLGNRFIHAPVLSFVSGRRYTDTTNGFRAYSAKYLLHPEVRPFRRVFSEYELLFYLTARANQLGLKTGEIPVTRSYPSDGHIPTKINGLRGNINLLSQLLATALRRYHP